MVVDQSARPTSIHAGQPPRLSHRGGAAIDLLVKMAALQIATCLEGRYVAILLVGGAARGESTFAGDGSLESDLDFLVVLRQRNVVAAIFEEQRCRRLLQPMGALCYQGREVEVSVGFANLAPNYWRVATPFMWELRTNSKALYGPAEVRDLPRIRRASQIPQWEGIRLIANRICELLASLGSMGQPGLGTCAEQEIRYSCLKLALACSEADLINRGQYKGTYRERLRQHELFAGDSKTGNSEHTALIASAYRVKLGLDGRIELDTASLVVATLYLALSTLGRFDLLSPVDLERRARTEQPAAPGIMSDLLFYFVSRRAGGRAPLRRPIAQVYAGAFRLASRVVSSPASALRDERITKRCLQLAEDYNRAPQVVSVVQGGRN